jgi:glycopeptide antibiotics resistance protein
MLKQFGPSTWVALAFGGLLAIMLFVPVAAFRYRKTGRLRVRDVAALVAVAVYFVALWSYTLVPMPTPSSLHCVGVNLNPAQFIDDIAADPRPLWRNRALLQVVFNVVLFVPMGFLLRVLARRGIVVAAILGLLTSAAIEFTQLTGVWGLYECAYRVFDVDDLLANTLGATVGSLLALPALRVIGSTSDVQARPARVSLGRRLVGVACDLLVMFAIGFGLVVAWRAFSLYVMSEPLDGDTDWIGTVLAVGVPAAVQLVWILTTGRTLGEATVRLEPVSGPGSVARSRIVKFACGIGGYEFLAALGVPLLLFVFCLVSLAAVIWSKDHRGLSHVVSGMRLRVERPIVAASAARPQPSGQGS